MIIISAQARCILGKVLRVRGRDFFLNLTASVALHSNRDQEVVIACHSPDRYSAGRIFLTDMCPSASRRLKGAKTLHSRLALECYTFRSYTLLQILLASCSGVSQLQYVPDFVLKKYIR